MTPDLIPFRAAARPATPEAPDAAVAALPRLTALRDALRAAALFRDALWTAATRWGEPAAFFFHPHPSDRPPPLPKHVAGVAACFPDEAGAWQQVPRLVAELDPALAAVTVRRAARAVRGLVAAAVELAADLPAAARLAGVLGIPDDEMFLVLHPAAGLGWRVRARGAADVAQFHVLLAATLPGSVAGGPKPSPVAVAAYRGGRLVADAPDVVPRFQLYRPQSVGADGLPAAGLAGCGHWLWGERPLSTVPTVNEERVVLLGDPVVETPWAAEPRFPLVPASVDVLEELPTAAVDGWLRDWAGAAPVRRPAAVARAA